MSLFDLLIQTSFHKRVDGQFRGKITILGMTFSCWLVYDHPLSENQNFLTLTFRNPERPRR